MGGSDNEKVLCASYLSEERNQKGSPSKALLPLPARCPEKSFRCTYCSPRHWPWNHSPSLSGVGIFYLLFSLNSAQHVCLKYLSCKHKNPKLWRFDVMVWNECVTKVQEYGHREYKAYVVISLTKQCHSLIPAKASMPKPELLWLRDRQELSQGTKPKQTLSPEPVAHWKHAFGRFVIKHPIRPGQNLCKVTAPCAKAKLKRAEFNMAVQKTNQTRGAFHWGNASACKRPSGTSPKSTQVYDNFLSEITEFYLVGWRKSLILEAIWLIVPSSP